MRTEPSHRRGSPGSELGLGDEITPADETTSPELYSPLAGMPGERIVEMASLTHLPAMIRFEEVSVHRAPGSWVIRPQFARLSGGDGPRATWTEADWRRRFASPRARWLTLHVGTTTVGLAELVRHGDGRTEIAVFGLSPEFRGRGLGRSGLTLVTQAAWALCDGRGTAAMAVWARINADAHSALLRTFLGCGFHVVSPVSQASGSLERA
jgi:GNAT superfamily N-acetyltransferase